MSSTKPPAAAAAAPADSASGNDRPEHSITLTGGPKRCGDEHRGVEPVDARDANRVEAERGESVDDDRREGIRAAEQVHLPGLREHSPDLFAHADVELSLARDEERAADVHRERSAGERIGEVVGSGDHHRLGGAGLRVRRLRDRDGGLDAVLAADAGSRCQLPPGRRAGR